MEKIRRAGTPRRSMSNSLVTCPVVMMAAGDLVEPAGGPIVLDPGGQMPGPHQQRPVTQAAPGQGRPPRNPGNCGCSGCPAPPRPGAGAARPGAQVVRPRQSQRRHRKTWSRARRYNSPRGSQAKASRWPRCRMARASTRMRRSCPPQPREASVCRMENVLRR